MPSSRFFTPVLLLGCSLAALPSCSSAQTSVYGAVAITAYGVEPSNSSALSFKSGTPGFVVGGFYNLPIDSRVTVGLDARLEESPGAKGGTAGAVCLRIGFVPHQVRLRPYFELGGGFLSTSTNTELVNDGVTAGTYSNGAAAVAFELDIRVTSTIDIRALELGEEASSTSGTVYLNTGVVYHFHPR